MRRKLLVPLIIALTITLGLASPATAKKPLAGPMDLQFNLLWPGPSEVVPTWVGTVTLDGTAYGIAFFNTGTGKSFDLEPDDTARFFEETWVIYRDLHYNFEEVDAGFILTEFEPGEVLLSGYDRGVFSQPNSVYRMNGYVEVANDPYADLLDRRVHMSGNLEVSPLGAPLYAPGTFRLN